jgi:L-ascorbate metabolism protein UlaG (beta-lactamase superfamily)
MNASFPISDHFDGQAFYNPGTVAQPRGLTQVLRWRRESTRIAWRPPPPDPAFPPPPSAVAAGTVAVTFINHASFLLRLPGGAVVLTDPIFSLRCSPVQWAGPRRARPPGIALADLPRPDIVLLSHNHYDHMDIPGLRAINRRHAPRFVTTLGNARVLARHGIDAVELDWWQNTTIDGLRLTATPARHFSARTPWDRNRALWGGFMLDTGASRILFAGDSGHGVHWEAIRERLGAPALALLPIGAYEPRWFMSAVHMNPAEAVEAHVALGAKQSIGMHFGTFQLTDEAIDAPLHALGAARTANGLAQDDFDTHGFGETRVYGLDG